MSLDKYAKFRVVTPDGKDFEYLSYRYAKARLAATPGGRLEGLPIPWGSWWEVIDHGKN